MHVHVQLCGLNQSQLASNNLPFLPIEVCFTAMSQKRKDKARGSKDVEEESAAASSTRSSTWYCDGCKKEIDDTPLALSRCFLKSSYLRITCHECTKKEYQESKEKRAKDKEMDASMNKKDAGMD